MIINSRQDKILLISVLGAKLLVFVASSTYLYFDEGIEISLLSYASSILGCFLIYRFFELGRHWLLIPIVYYLFTFGFVLVKSQRIVNSLDKKDIPLGIAGFMLSALLVAVLIYLYKKSLNRNASSANVGDET
jgi:hypothetical protein